MPSSVEDIIYDECTDIRNNIILIFSKLSEINTFMNDNLALINNKFTILEQRISNIEQSLSSISNVMI